MPAPCAPLTAPNLFSEEPLAPDHERPPTPSGPEEASGVCGTCGGRKYTSCWYDLNGYKNHEHCRRDCPGCTGKAQPSGEEEEG